MLINLTMYNDDPSLITIHSWKLLHDGGRSRWNDSGFSGNSHAIEADCHRGSACDHTWRLHISVDSEEFVFNVAPNTTTSFWRATGSIFGGNLTHRDESACGIRFSKNQLGGTSWEAWPGFVQLLSTRPNGHTVSSRPRPGM